MIPESGTRVGPYEVVSPIGEGGMGIVVRARDTKLQRDVALKFLPDNFVNDVDRVTRFQREAEVLASLNHPNIAQVYGLEESGGRRCIVMEFVEGETLADRMKNSAIPIDETLEIAKQIAQALEDAHERGIVHRDLKPANIKMTRSGVVKVLDFGLAKMNAAEGSASISNSPTLMTRVSTPGMMLGTAAYMSPEQVKGKETDRTLDVWAYGCVLYEMLCGYACFPGETVGEIVAGILKSEPDWTRLPVDTPVRIRRLLKRCLTKDRKLRLQHLGDARIEIEDTAQDSQTNLVKVPRVSRWAIAFFATALALVLTFVWLSRPQPSLPELRLHILAPPGGLNRTGMAISPDGSTIVAIGVTEGHTALWLRSLSATQGKFLEKTANAEYPFWSPDGRSIGFFADSKLKRFDVETGSVQTLANASAARGGTWNLAGIILFPPTNSGPLFQVSATGGTPVAVTQLKPQQANHRLPQFLPDGVHFLYYATGSSDVRGVYIGNLNGSDDRRILDGEYGAVFSAGRLLFVRAGTLLDQRFDWRNQTLIGEPTPISPDVLLTVQNGAAVSAAENGTIIYRSGGTPRARQLVWFDREGKQIEQVGDIDFAEPSAIALSPSGRQLALQRVIDGNQDIWLMDLGRGIRSRFTTDPAVERNAIWSPDGTRIVFDSNRNGAYDLYEKSIIAGANEEILLSTPQAKSASDWSRDGRFVLYRSNDPNVVDDIWALSRDGKQKPFRAAQSKSDELNGQFSPNAKWMAYDSDQSGRREIYVQRFPDGSGKIQVSNAGGWQPRWRSDGDELFYVGLDDRLMAVPIKKTSNDGTLEAGVPIPLFATRLVGTAQSIAWQYVASSDGKRFLVNTVLQEPPSTITVVLNRKAK